MAEIDLGKVVGNGGQGGVGAWELISTFTYATCPTIDFTKYTEIMITMENNTAVFYIFIPTCLLSDTGKCFVGSGGLSGSNMGSYSHACVTKSAIVTVYLRHGNNVVTVSNARLYAR